MIVLLDKGDPCMLFESEVDYHLPVQFPHFEDCGLRVARIDAGHWLVVEPRTGRRISIGTTSANAYAKAAKVLRAKGRAEFDARVARAIAVGEAAGPYCDVPRVTYRDTAVTIVPAGTRTEKENEDAAEVGTCAADDVRSADAVRRADTGWSYEHDRPACYVQPGFSGPVYG